jgi:hypothetical protein
MRRLLVVASLVALAAVPSAVLCESPGAAAPVKAQSAAIPATPAVNLPVVPPAVQAQAVTAPAVPVASAGVGATVLHVLAIILGLTGVLVIGHITVPIVRVITNASQWIDGLSPFLKRVIAMAVASGLTAAFGVLAPYLPNGFVAPDTLAKLGDPTAVAAMLAAIVAYIAHLDQQTHRTQQGSQATPASRTIATG